MRKWGVETGVRSTRLPKPSALVAARRRPRATILSNITSAESAFNHLDPDALRFTALSIKTRDHQLDCALVERLTSRKMFLKY